jgi:hypothetical protein
MEGLRLVGMQPYLERGLNRVRLRVRLFLWPCDCVVVDCLLRS